MNVNESFLSSLGLARKAGKLVIGWDRIRDYGGKVPLLIVTSDASEKIASNAEHDFSRVIRIPETMETVGRSLGIGKAAFVAVTDDGFAGLLQKKLSQ